MIAQLFSFLIAIAFLFILDIPNRKFRQAYYQWKQTVPMSLERKAAAHKFKVWIAPGMIIYAVIAGWSLLGFMFGHFIGYTILVILWGYLFYGDYKKIKEVLDDEDFFKKLKSKAKRWIRNTFAVRKIVSNKVGG